MKGLIVGAVFMGIGVADTLMVLKDTRCYYCGRTTKGTIPTVRGKRWCGCYGVGYEKY